MQEFADINSSADPMIVEKKIQKISDEITSVWTALMGYEMQLVDQLEVCKLPIL